MNSELSTQIAPPEVGRIPEALDTRTRDLDSVLGEAVQRAFMEAAGLRAAEKLSQVHRATGVRFARWSFGVVSACALVPTILTWMLMPSREQLLQARQNLEQLSAGAAQLSRQGGRIELRHCGAANRLCVRVDRKSPFYGQDADFMVLKGY